MDYAKEDNIHLTSSETGYVPNQVVKARHDLNSELKTFQVPYPNAMGNCEFKTVTFGHELPLKSCRLYVVTFNYLHFVYFLLASWV